MLFRQTALLFLAASACRGEQTWTENSSNQNEAAKAYDETKNTEAFDAVEEEFYMEEIAEEPEDNEAFDNMNGFDMNTNTNQNQNMYNGNSQNENTMNYDPTNNEIDYDMNMDINMNENGMDMNEMGGSDPFGNDPFGGAGGDDPFGNDPFGNDPFGNDPYGAPDDDIFSAFAEQGAAMAGMMFGKCFDGMDLNALMEHPFADVDNRCTTMESEKFNNALFTFNSCSGFDLRELIETFGSVYLGLILNCGSYAMEVADDLLGDIDFATIERLKAKETPLPRVPQECVDAMVGDNPFGQSFLYMDEYPEREMGCFRDLANKLPKCTLNEWPIPIVGSWLKAISCVYGSMNDFVVPLMEESLIEQMNTMADCLPEDITTDKCKDIRTSCIFDSEDPVFAMLMPPPFWGPPMFDQCKTIANENGLDNVVERYEMFREVCVPAEDQAIWDIKATFGEADTSTEGGAASFLDAAEEESVYSTEASVLTESASSSSKFVPGMITGMIVAALAMVGLKRMSSRGQLPAGYGGLDTFEMTQSSREFA